MKGIADKKQSAGIARGVGQLSLVEHALCPLHRTACEGSHRSIFNYTDSNGKRQTATATVTSPFGLFPSDEFFLWGLLGLTFAQLEPSSELYATPHFILRHLDCINANSDRGG